MNAISAYADALVACVSGLLPKGSDIALTATLRVSISNYNGMDESDPVGGYLHLVCHAPNNYVGVFAAYSTRPRMGQEGLPWTCIGCHDSCWRDSLQGFLTKAYDELEAKAERVFEWPVAKLSVHLHMDKIELALAQDALGKYIVDRKPQAFDWQPLQTLESR